MGVFLYRLTKFETIQIHCDSSLLVRGAQVPRRSKTLVLESSGILTTVAVRVASRP